MGLFGLFRGGNAFEKSLEDIDKKIHEPNWNLVVKHGRELGIESGNMAIGAASALTLGRCINEFSTHYVRTQLTIHPKWTTEGNFKDMCLPLCATICLHFRTMCRSELPSRKQFELMSMVFREIEEGPSFKSLIEDMFKNAPLQSLAEHYPRQTRDALVVLERMHEEYAMKSSHEFSHEHFSEFIDVLKVTWI